MDPGTLSFFLRHGFRIVFESPYFQRNLRQDVQVFSQLMMNFLDSPGFTDNEEQFF
jgi:hypothetical protein